MMNTPKTLKPLTMDEVKAIRAEASPLLQNTIDLVMLTAQRRSDVLSMRHSDIQGMTLHVTQQKTGIQKQINITPELQEVIDRCYDGSTTGYILHKSGKRVSDVANNISF